MIVGISVSYVNSHKVDGECFCVGYKVGRWEGNGLGVYVPVREWFESKRELFSLLTLDTFVV